MGRRTLSLSAALAFSVAIAAAPAPKGGDGLVFIDLKGKTNVKFDENLHSNDFANNNLKALPTGKQKLGDATYNIQDGVLQLGSAMVQGKPDKIEGIKVGTTAQKLHFLQACGYNTDAGTVIGKYVIRYADKTTVDIEIVFGKHAVDWWAYPDRAAPTDVKVAWEGENEAAKGFDAKIKLYTMTWKNPHPAKSIATIDFMATNPEQNAAPFCVAITAEKK